MLTTGVASNSSNAIFSMVLKKIQSSALSIAWYRCSKAARLNGNSAKIWRFRVKDLSGHHGNIVEISWGYI